MDNSFTAAPNRNTELKGGKCRECLVAGMEGKTFRCQAAQYFSNCNGSNTPTLLATGKQGGSAQVRHDERWGLS